MVATVVWIGGLSALAIFVLPTARRVLEAESYAKFLADLQRRLDPIGWFCLAVLAGTGMVQLGANPHYKGLLVIQSGWALAILLKHLAFLSMACLSAYLTWGLMPRLQHNALQRARSLRSGDGDQPFAYEAAKLQRQETLLLRLNLALGVVILGLTAMARAA